MQGRGSEEEKEEKEEDEISLRRKMEMGIFRSNQREMREEE
jgi:hypothetical protein